MKNTIFTPFLLGLALGQSHRPQCGSSTDNGGPSLTMQFTPTMPVQIAPVSTVYGAIMTSYLNVVDCKYVMVQNVNDNLPQTVSKMCYWYDGTVLTEQGQFTTRTTVPVLTVYRVGCMPETTAVTRRDYRGYDMTETSVAPTAISLPEPENGAYVKRAMLQPSIKKEVLGIAQRLASGIDPTNENITVREFKYLEQINTALFALNLVNSGFDLDQMCEYLKDASMNERLEDNMINSGQASNIICFAAQYGLFFGMSNNELLADLAALEYAIQLHAYATKSLQELCEGLDYTAASFLGIDTGGIRSYICNGTAGISSTIAVPSDSITTPSAGPVGTGTGGAGTFSGPNPTGTVSIIFGSDGPMLSSATSAAGSVAPFFNTTTTATIDLTTVTASLVTAGAETITSVMRPLFYPPRSRRHDRYHF